MAKKQFKAESKRLLDLMINSIYTNKEIFLREIISNASDAIDKLCYQGLTDEGVGLSRDEFKIDIVLNKDERTITVSDNGIGMTREEAENNLGVIAKSGSYAFKNEMEANDETAIIGQFGVGFYSAFMVSDKVTVITRRYGEESATKWESSGADGYTVSDAERAAAGTDVIMHIKEDTEEELYGTYLEVWKIKALVKKYSDYVRWPIKMDVPHQEQKETGEKDDAGNPKYTYEMVTTNETINSMVPIWQRSKAEISDEDCVAYYKERYRAQKEPYTVLRVNAEGTLSYKAMLFIPGETDEEYLIPESRKGITLYSNGVMITEKCEDIVHDYFEFVCGVVDSPDLSLNISREILQHNRQLHTIGTSIEKKIKGDLEKMMTDDRPKYEEFFKNFGVHLKCGVCDEYGRYKDFLKDLLLFYTSEESQMTLKEYADGMPESQKVIYYASSDSVKHAMSLPQCEEVRSRGYNLIYLTSPLDEMVIENLHDVDGKIFCNVVSEDLGFETDEEKKQTEEKNTENKEFLDFVAEAAGEEITKAEFSGKLASQPCAITTEGPVSLEMEKYFRRGPSEEMRKVRATKVLSLNGGHEAVQKTKELFDAGEKDKAKEYIEILNSLARLMAGLEIEDISELTKKITNLF